MIRTSNNKVALYARFSSDNQRTESIDAQIRAMNVYCEQNGYTIVKTYVDEAKSATTDRRPSFQQMITAIEYHASENLLKQFKQYEESLEIINHKIQTGEYVIEIKDSEKKAFLNNVADYMCNSESVDVRLFLNNVIKEINICNDDVEVRLNVA